MKIYCFSGLGTDERVFQQFTLEHELIVIPWIKPFPKESLDTYAIRLSAQIDNSSPFILMGVSFGGMIASSLATKLNPVKTIIISSAACRKELPLKMRLFYFFPLELIPAKHFIPPLWIVSRFFGVKRGFFFELLKQIIHESDPYLVKWSVYQIIKWKQKQPPKKLIRIHSDKDILLPKQNNVIYDYILKGGHFMIAEKTLELSGIINKELAML